MNAIGAKESLMTATVSRNDPFNYPAVNRAMCMSMSTINPQDGFKTTTANFKSARRNSSNLFTGDIEGKQLKFHLVGSSPKKFGSIEVNKQDFTNFNGDIDRSAPQMLHFALNKAETNMKTDDILFCKPQVFKFQTNRASKPQNPLAPNYNLPIPNPKPMTPRKFIKDTLRTSDIDKSSPAQFISRKQSLHNYLDNSDIEGSKASPRAKQRSTIYDCYNYHDVVKPEPSKILRQIDPLSPIYTAIGEDGKGYQIGPVDGAKSKVGRDPLTGAKDLNKCNDVLGAMASTKGLGVFEYHKRREFGISQNTLDIPGAQASSLMRGIKTTRNGNPLDTNYKYPGQTELETKDPYSKTKKEIEARKKQTSIISKAGQQVLLEKHTQADQKSPQELVRQAFDGPKTTSQKFDSFVKK